MTRLRLILDSHVVLWMITRERRLREETHRAILDAGNQVFVSAASLWEIEIKRASGKLQAPDNVIEFIEGSGFVELPITFQHSVQAGNLPLRHRDIVRPDADRPSAG